MEKKQTKINYSWNLRRGLVENVLYKRAQLAVRIRYGYAVLCRILHVYK